MHLSLRIPRYRALPTAFCIPGRLFRAGVLDSKPLIWRLRLSTDPNRIRVLTASRRPASSNMSSKDQPGLSESSEVTENVNIATDALSDEFGYDGQLDHAPATSHGTYLDGINESLEPLEEYQEGGFHPIHLDDMLGTSGRYRVIHKLGHGGFGTVWLCRDLQDPGYVAVKVMAGDVAPETLSDLKLTQFDQSASGAEHIAIPLDTFSIIGPNGSHQCVVLPVLGPCVSPRLWLRLKDPEPVLRGMAYQSALAMSFLHKQGFCHGGKY